MTLPFVTAEFRVPQLHAPSMGLPHVSGQELTEAARAVGSRLPAREQLTHAAGLGAGVMVVLIERPVATVVAAARGFVPKRVRPGGADRARAARKSTT